MDGGVKVQTWLSEVSRQRFAAIAAHEGVSESAMLRRLVELMLATANAGQSQASEPASSTTTPPTKISVRLRAEDHLLLRERATARRMAAARYASIYLRAHLRNLAPLPKAEYQALKNATAELACIGRNLNQLARAAHRGERVRSIRDDIKPFIQVCTALRGHVDGLLADNANSWKQGHAD